MPDSPLICHLLNSSYNPESDCYAALNSVTVTIAKGMLGRTFSSATLYSSDHEPIAVDCYATEIDTSAVVAELGMWAVLKLK